MMTSDSKSHPASTTFEDMADTAARLERCRASALLRAVLVEFHMDDSPLAINIAQRFDELLVSTKMREPQEGQPGGAPPPSIAGK